MLFFYNRNPNLSEAEMTNIKESVKDYYGKELQGSNDLKTNACCTIMSYPDKIKNILGSLHSEVVAKYYGCGLTIPEEIEGLDILDLGSGSGRDCYIASALVGEKGSVIGVDMTDEQLSVAQSHLQYHADQFGYERTNVDFLKGDIEQLDRVGIEKDSKDVIISNCVINLATDKRKILADCYEILRDGGEMYFSDVYCDRRLPWELAKDRVVWGECLGGALYWNDFLLFSKDVGFKDPRIVEVSPITIQNKELEDKLKGYNFYSVTYRLWKLPNLERDNEDYGQSVVYQGTVEGMPEEFLLDQDNTFTKGKSVSVCGNTFLMLKNTRFKDHFKFCGNFENHRGIFKGRNVESPFSDYSDRTKKTGCC